MSKISKFFYFKRIITVDTRFIRMPEWHKSIVVTIKKFWSYRSFLKPSQLLLIKPFFVKMFFTGSDILIFFLIWAIQRYSFQFMVKHKIRRETEKQLHFHWKQFNGSLFKSICSSKQINFHSYKFLFEAKILK